MSKRSAARGTAAASSIRLTLRTSTPSRQATPAPRAASCFAKEAVRQGRPEPPPLPFRSHPSPRLRQIKGGGLQSHQASRVQEFLMGGEVSRPTKTALSCCMARLLCVRLGARPSGATLVGRIARDEPPPLQKRTYGLPDVLDRVQFGRSGRQQHKREVVWHDKILILGAVPSSPVHQH